MNFSEIVRRNVDSLAAFVRRRAGGVVRAKENVSDIVQSTFREMVQAEHRIENRGEESLRRWLRTVAECKIRSRARHWAAANREAGRDLSMRRALGSDAEIADWQPAAQQASPCSEAAFREVEERLEQAFQRLPEDYQAVIKLVKVEGLTHAQVAVQMERAETTTRKLLSRALARLSFEMEPSFKAMSPG